MADAPRFSVTVEGLDSVMRALQKKLKEYPEAAKVALYRGGIRIHGPAVKRAPREFGVLRASAYVSAPRMEGGFPVVEMGFGTHYAAAQHEGNYQHVDGERHYLANAVSEQLGTMLQRMGADIDDAVKNGTKFGQVGGVPTRPNIQPGTGKHSNKNGRARFKKQLANVKARTGR